MKKLFVLIIGVLMIFPLSVKADMGAPEIKSYKVVTKSSDGASYYDYEFKEAGKIKSGEKIEITYEEIHKGDVYGSFYTSEKSGYVKLSDFKLADKQDVDEYDAKYVGRVFEKDGVDVYAGPSYINEKIGKTIPYNTKIAVSDFIEYGTWLYVEYNDVKGYVDASNGAVGIYSTGFKVDPSDLTIYKEFYRLDDWSWAIMVKDKKDYKKISTRSLAYIYNDKNKVVTKEDCTVYKTAYEEKYEKVGIIEKGTKLKPLYFYGDYGFEAYYVESGDIKGWLKSVDNNGEYVFTCFNAEYKNPLSDDEYPYDKYVTIDSEKDPEKDEKKEDKKDTKKAKKVSPSAEKIIIFSACGALLVVLTATVTIILVNKKKNKKEDSVQD